MNNKRTLIKISIMLITNIFFTVAWGRYTNVYATQMNMDNFKDIINYQDTLELANEDNIIVNIPDKNLKEVLNLELGQEKNSDITKRQLQDIGNINAANKNITDLTGLEYCTNLYNLNLSNNNIINIEPLENLRLLWTLDLSHNNIKDVSALKKSGKVAYLNLSYNAIEKITEFPNIDYCAAVDLSNNNISDISGIKSIKASTLESLDLGYNNIEDLSSFPSWLIVMNLSLNNNNISNIEALALTGWGSLDISHNKIYDISPLTDKYTVNLNATNQVIKLNEKTIEGTSITIRNKIKDINGVNISPSFISDNGYISGEHIVWNNTDMKSEVYYEFENIIDEERINVRYSGLVIQPINYIINNKEDVNKDGNIDILDVALIASKYNIKNEHAEWNSNYDLNSDNIIDIYDIVIISKKI